MAALSLLDIAALGFASLSYLPLLAALSLSVLLILFGTGPGNSSAKVNLGPFQPIEGIRSAAGVVPRGLLRAAVGTAARAARHVDP